MASESTNSSTDPNTTEKTDVASTLEAQLPKEVPVSYVPITIVTILLGICAYGFYTSFDILKSAGIVVEMPSNIAEIKVLDQTFQVLSENHFWTTAVLFCSLYIIKQTFAIPGSLILNITAGRLFGVYLGFAFTTLRPPYSITYLGVQKSFYFNYLSYGKIIFNIHSFALACTTVGAGCCYALSYTFLQRFVKTCFPGRLLYLQGLVDQYRSDLLQYLVIMRAISFIPNWFVNLASPVLGIPILIHTIAVGIGMAPYHWICASAGSFLTEIESPADIFDRSAIIKILILVSISGLYLVLRRKYGTKANIKAE